MCWNVPEWVGEELAKEVGEVELVRHGGGGWQEGDVGAGAGVGGGTQFALNRQ